MKFGLVLSGGGARGIAHLGIIQALEEEGIQFSVVSGASAGAIIGAFLCAGYGPQEVADILKRTNLLRMVRPSFNWRSLLNIETAAKELRKYFPDDSFQALRTPLRVTTTDIRKGEVKVFKKGKLIQPILASSSIPVIFDPIKIRKRVLVDGGIMDNLPVKPIRKEVDKVIALHCNPIDQEDQIKNWKSLFERTMMLAITQVAYTQKKFCDVFLEPPGLSKYNVFDFSKAPEIYSFGYEYAKAEIENGVLEPLLVKQ